jgi:hypothetical protein
MVYINDFDVFSEKTMDFGEENVPILRIQLRGAVISAQANSGLKKTAWACIPRSGCSGPGGLHSGHRSGPDIRD